MNQMQQMLQQAQRMQRQLQKAHAELDAKEFTVEKAGLVTVILTGDKKVKSISVDKDALNPDDAEMVQYSAAFSGSKSDSRIRLIKCDPTIAPSIMSFIGRTSSAVRIPNPIITGIFDTAFTLLRYLMTSRWKVAA